MGKKRSNQSQWYKKRDKKEKAAKPAREDTRQPYEACVRENAAFSHYYRHLFDSQEEFDRFMACLQQPLPATFRITSHRPEMVAWVQSQMQDRWLPRLPGEAEAKPLPWYDLAWQLSADRRLLRNTPSLGQFHRWLVSLTENGDVSRQEAVSMIPPLLLGVEPHHRVLDMCAAPGSKTAQLVEALHAQGIPTGMVIANDVSQQRAYLLHHQVKRILSPSLLVTNNDGTHYPNIFPEGSDQALQFDRVLCDAPCSGDGTLRKNPGLWRQWNAHLGLGMHPLQIKLLDRALQLCHTGGRVVYSTCSLNPVENEAVVAALLSRYAGKIRLVDCADKLPGLARRPGMQSWTVIDRQGNVIPDVASVPAEHSRRFPATCFPNPQVASELSKCWRIMPHDQDTGAFFIALFEKVDELTPSALENRRRKKPKVTVAEVSVEEEEGAESALGEETSVPEDLAEGELKLKELKPHLQDVLTVIPREDETLCKILQFYGIESSMAFLSRSSDHRSISMVCPMVAQVLNGLHPNPRQRHLRVINAGIRAFELFDARPEIINRFPCAHRLLMESGEILAPFITRKVTIDALDLKSLLCSNDGIPLDQLRSFQGPEGEGGVLACSATNPPVMVPLWKGTRIVKAFVPKLNRPALLSQLGFEEETQSGETEVTVGEEVAVTETAESAKIAPALE